MPDEIPEELMTDDEVAKILRISMTTLRTHIKNGPPTQRHTNSDDLRKIKQVVIGGKRRWQRASVMKFIQGEL